MLKMQSSHSTSSIFIDILRTLVLLAEQQAEMKERTIDRRRASLFTRGSATVLLTKGFVEFL